MRSSASTASRFRWTLQGTRRPETTSGNCPRERLLLHNTVRVTSKELVRVQIELVGIEFVRIDLVRNNGWE